MDNNHFDDLTRVLATDGLTRRRVLRGLGGLLGAALAGAGWRQTLAAKGGNSACAQWCHAQFSGKAAGQCTSEAAQGGGLCYECGPGAAGESGPLCGTTCCSSGQVCLGYGQCGDGGTVLTNPNGYQPEYTVGFELAGTDDYGNHYCIPTMSVTNAAPSTSYNVTFDLLFDPAWMWPNATVVYEWKTQLTTDTNGQGNVAPTPSLATQWAHLVAYVNGVSTGAWVFWQDC